MHAALARPDTAPRASHGTGHISKAAAIAAGRCSRCRDGSGFVKHSAGRLHWGVPNLCFACDGGGTRAAELQKQAEIRESERIQKLYDAVQERRRRVAERAGDHPRMPPRARRAIAWGMAGRTFTAAEYGQASGLATQEAYVELCCWTCAHPIIDPATGTPIGWQVS